LKEAAAYLHVSSWAIYDLTRRRGRMRVNHPIRCIRFGKTLRLRKSSLDRWLSELEREWLDDAG